MLGDDSTLAFGMSADGFTIVGQANKSDLPLDSVATVWNQVAGWRLVEDILTDHGIDLSGWQLTRAVAVSANGRAIVGEGVNPAGQTEGWLAVIAVPEPSSLALCGVLVFVLPRFRRATA